MLNEALDRNNSDADNIDLEELLAQDRSVADDFERLDRARTAHAFALSSAEERRDGFRHGVRHVMHHLILRNEIRFAFQLG